MSFNMPSFVMPHTKPPAPVLSTTLPGLPKRKMEEMIETFPFRYNEVIRIVFREVGLKTFRAGCCSTTP